VSLYRFLSQINTVHNLSPFVRSLLFAGIRLSSAGVKKVADLFLNLPHVISWAIQIP